MLTELTYYRDKVRYRGHRTEAGCLVEVLPERMEGARAVGVPLRHWVRHSPTGFEWGYGGSGPADLARSILAHHLGDVLPSPRVYQRFKDKVIATMARTEDGQHWEISSGHVAAQLEVIMDEIGAKCPICLDFGYEPESQKKCRCNSEPDYD